MALERDDVTRDGRDGRTDRGSVPMGVEEDMRGRGDSRSAGDSGINETQSIVAKLSLSFSLSLSLSLSRLGNATESGCGDAWMRGSVGERNAAKFGAIKLTKRKTENSHKN